MPDPPTSENRDWTAALRAGDRSAFESLFHSHYAALCAFARRYVEDLSRAEELVQDVFLALWERRETLELRRSIRAYLFTAVRNAALDELKRRKTAARLGRDAADALRPPKQAADSQATFSELARAVDAAVQDLPPRAREVFTMSREGGLSYGEIAEILGITVKAVEANMTRALRSLREALSPFIDPR